MRLPLLALTLAVIPGLQAAAATLPHTSAWRNTAGWTDLGPHDRTAALPVTIALPLRNQVALDQLLTSLYDPHDMLYGQYLTPEQFRTRFYPAQADVDAVTAFAKAQGFQVVKAEANTTLVKLSAPTPVVEKAFGIHVHDFKAPDGAVHFAPDADPSLPDSVATVVSGVFGLENLATLHPAGLKSPATGAARLLWAAINGLSMSPSVVGTAGGVLGNLTPQDIRSLYNLNSFAYTGAGQNLALIEYDGYYASDIQAYEQKYSLPQVPLANILIDGASGAPSSSGNSLETTSDIEMAVALAPGLSHIFVYIAPNDKANYFDVESTVANNNLARQVTDSWGIGEPDIPTQFMYQENVYFSQMAAQGQSVFVASGDYGQYYERVPGNPGESNMRLGPLDPAGQPFVTSVGGTVIRYTYVCAGDGRAVPGAECCHEWRRKCA